MQYSLYVRKGGTSEHVMAASLSRHRRKMCACLLGEVDYQLPLGSRGNHLDRGSRPLKCQGPLRDEHDLLAVNTKAREPDDLLRANGESVCRIALHARRGKHENTDRRPHGDNKCPGRYLRR